MCILDPRTCDVSGDTGKCNVDRCLCTDPQTKAPQCGSAFPANCWLPRDTLYNCANVGDKPAASVVSKDCLPQDCQMVGNVGSCTVDLADAPRPKWARPCADPSFRTRVNSPTTPCSRAPRKEKSPRQARAVCRKSARSRTTWAREPRILAPVLMYKWARTIVVLSSQATAYLPAIPCTPAARLATSLGRPRTVCLRTATSTLPRARAPVLQTHVAARLLRWVRCCVTLSSRAIARSSVILCTRATSRATSRRCPRTVHPRSVR